MFRCSSWVLKRSSLGFCQIWGNIVFTEPGGWKRFRLLAFWTHSTWYNNSVDHIAQFNHQGSFILMTIMSCCWIWRGMIALTLCRRALTRRCRPLRISASWMAAHHRAMHVHPGGRTGSDTSVANIRNIGIIAHVDAVGKLSTSAMIYTHCENRAKPQPLSACSTIVV